MIELFRKAQVYQFGKSFWVNHYILRFEVSENNVFGVKMAYGI